MMMMGMDKKRMTDSIVEGIVGGEKKYSTNGKEMGDGAKLCAMEFLRAIETKDTAKLIASLEALMFEIESMSGEEEESEGPKIEIEL